jgi:hypothetical protein
MSFRDTLVQLGFVMIALGAVLATWALYTGPLDRYTKSLFRRGRRDDPRT